MNEATRERTNRNDTRGNKPVCTIELQTNKIFLPFVSDIGKLPDRSFRGIDDWPLADFKLPTLLLVSGHYLSSFVWA